MCTATIGQSNGGVHSPSSLPAEVVERVIAADWTATKSGAEKVRLYVPAEPLSARSLN